MYLMRRHCAYNTCIRFLSMRLRRQNYWRCIAMNGIKIPKFLEGENLPKDYFETPDPYRSPKSSVILLELSRYAQREGKALIDLTKEEVKMFAVQRV